MANCLRCGHEREPRRTKYCVVCAPIVRDENERRHQRAYYERNKTRILARQKAYRERVHTVRYCACGAVLAFHRHHCDPCRDRRAVEASRRYYRKARVAILARKKLQWQARAA